jgi:hypothetical protein
MPHFLQLLTCRRCLWLLVLLTSLGTALAEETVSKEYQIKAAYLYNFAKFVEWPADSFANGDSPLVIGVFGQNPFGKELEAIAQAHQINGRPIVIRSITSAAGAAGVHLMFICATDDNQVAAILGSLKNTAILTVGESRKFMDAGGIIDFVREADKVRFEVSAMEAERHGLKISAQLLKLATVVRKNPEARP